MHTTIVKKRLASGEPCRKCAQVDEMLERRGLSHRIDEVVFLVEGDDSSAGARLARKHGIATAPFFVIRADDGSEEVISEAVRLVERLRREDARASTASPTTEEDLEAAAARLESASPQEVLRWGLERYGERCVIAFSGAEDVALIDMAARIGLPFSVLTLDTGRLHAETYRFIERVRTHYGVSIQATFPEAAAVERLVRSKGLFSFYTDGHQECCGIRKVKPLRRALTKYAAWATGQRRDQSPTRTEVGVLEVEPRADTTPRLIKLNPLAAWTSDQVWEYIRAHEVPYNELHDRGFVSIGCEPCTRARRPGEHERAARWWWEEATQRECGLHVNGKA